MPVRATVSLIYSTSRKSLATVSIYRTHPQSEFRVASAHGVMRCDVWERAIQGMRVAREWTSVEARKEHEEDLR